MDDKTITDTVLAEREYEAHAAVGSEARRVLLRIGRPRPDRRMRGEWVCPFQILGLGEDDVLEANGVDAVQALYLAMVMAGARLNYPPSGLTITWLGGPDLNLPLPSPAAMYPSFEEDDTPDR